MNIPAGRVVRDVDEEGAIQNDLILYGDAYVQGEIPEHWGALWRRIESDLMKSISENEDFDTLSS